MSEPLDSSAAAAAADRAAREAASNANRIPIPDTPPPPHPLGAEPTLILPMYCNAPHRLLPRLAAGEVPEYQLHLRHEPLTASRDPSQNFGIPGAGGRGGGQCNGITLFSKMREDLQYLFLAYLSLWRRFFAVLLRHPVQVARIVESSVLNVFEQFDNEIF
jgi:hypothetical protein